MKLTDEHRLKLFNQARALSPTLGDLLQNPMDLTDEDIQREIDAGWKHLREETERINAYVFALGDILYFPEKVPQQNE